MSKIGIDEVKRLAELAKIKLTDEQISQLSVELGRIVAYVEQLQSVDTTKVEPTNQVTGLVDVWREDEIKPSSITREKLLSNAPMQQDGYIKVKRVLE